MEKIAIIGANEFQNRLILKAKNMGYETHVFAWKSGDIGEKNADYFYPISITEKEKILEKCREIKPVAVVSIASDLAVITVNYVAKNLGLVCNEPKDSIVCTNKYEMRKKLKLAKLIVPEFEKVHNENELAMKNYPLIVKPTDRSGSRAIALVKNDNEMKKALSNAIDNSFEKCAIVEEVIEGEEYSCECISQNGKHYCLAITKKFTTGFPKCIETGHIEPSDLSEHQLNQVKKNVFLGLNALNIKNGASHTEFKINEKNEIGIIEIGARMGGDCIGSDLVQISTGNDFLKLVIDVATGKEIEVKEDFFENVAIIKFIFSNDDLNKLEKFSKIHPDYLYYKSEIKDTNHEIIDSSSRYGFYIFKIPKNKSSEINYKEELGL